VTECSALVGKPEETTIKTEMDGRITLKWILQEVGYGDLD
jgi:hypothetical protein